MKKNVLVIVAHPDDETIWMGGTLLREKGNWDVTIMSLCRKDDKDRAPKFKRVCRMLKAECFMSDLEDEKISDVSLHEVIKRIKKYADREYDYIFTHGSNGEYGHKRHKDVHQAVKEMLKKKLLSCEKIFFFSYIKKGAYCYPNKKANKFINLSNFDFARKKKLIQEIYGFNKKSFEMRCCRKIETFKIKET